MFGRLVTAMGLVAGIVAAGACHAADLAVLVRDKAGRPVRVWLNANTGAFLKQVDL